MHGYPQFSFGISRALAKFCFLRIVLNRAKIIIPVLVGTTHRKSYRGTQQIVSVNYLFGMPLIPYDFLKGIFTSNFRDMGNLRPSVFGLIKMSFLVPKKGQLRFSERK